MKEAETKRKQKKKKVAKLREDEHDDVKVARAKCNGTYRPGGNIIDGGFEADDEGINKDYE